MKEIKLSCYGNDHLKGLTEMLIKCERKKDFWWLDGKRTNGVYTGERKTTVRIK